MKKPKAKPPTNFDQYQSVDYIWNVLCDYRENSVPDGVDDNDEIWDEICTAMAWIEDALGIRHGKKIEVKHCGIERDEAMNRFSKKLQDKLKSLTPKEK